MASAHHPFWKASWQSPSAPPKLPKHVLEDLRKYLSRYGIFIGLIVIPRKANGNRDFYICSDQYDQYEAVEGPVWSVLQAVLAKGPKGKGAAVTHNKHHLPNKSLRSLHRPLATLATLLSRVSKMLNLKIGRAQRGFKIISCQTIDPQKWLNRRFFSGLCSASRGGSTTLESEKSRSARLWSQR